MNIPRSKNTGERGHKHTNIPRSKNKCKSCVKETLHGDLPTQKHGKRVQKHQMYKI